VQTVKCWSDQETLGADKPGAYEISLIRDVTPEGFRGRLIDWLTEAWTLDSLPRIAIPTSHYTAVEQVLLALNERWWHMVCYGTLFLFFAVGPGWCPKHPIPCCLNAFSISSSSPSFYCNKGLTERKPTSENTNRNITKKKIVSDKLITVTSVPNASSALWNIVNSQCPWS